MDNSDKAEAVERYWRDQENKIFHAQVVGVNRFGETVSVEINIVELSQCVQVDFYPEDFGKIGIEK